MTRLLLWFFYALFLSVTLPLLLPDLRLFYFAPFLVISYYSGTLLHSLWWSIITGGIVDLFSAGTRFGSCALIYCLTTLFLHRYKYYFFEDRPTTLPIMTYLFVLISTILQALLYQIFEDKTIVSLEWLKRDIGLMPLKDALFAWTCFTLPRSIILRQRRSLRRRKRA